MSRVRRVYGLRRVGHGGTLDPAVTGVLPIAVGAATRLLPYLCGDKAYVGTIQLGLSTSSDDLEGEPLRRQPVPLLNAAQLQSVLGIFQGTIQQRPPCISAVHVHGERAYRLARRGVAVELSPRPVTIRSLELLGWDQERAQLSVAVHCSAGTYIRALARDLGERLGCGGSLASLRRTAALGFGLEGSLQLDQLDRPDGVAPPPLLDPLPALAHLPSQQLSTAELESWRCGRSIAAHPGLVDGDEQNPPVVVIGPDGALVGMARRAVAGRLQPVMVLEARG